MVEPSNRAFNFTMLSEKKNRDHQQANVHCFHLNDEKKQHTYTGVN